MMENKKTTLHIFYSWQSDSPNKTNLNAIRNSLRETCVKLESVDASLTLMPDEATRDTSGSPRIPDKITEKIEEAAIFIADITTVTPKDAERPCPNPNVVFELGYAVATLGWDRIILLFNKAMGTFPTDLPFDFSHNRASPYEFAENDDFSTKSATLSKLLEIAIGAVIKKNPKRPAEQKGLTPEKIKHDHDVDNMRWLMEILNIHALQQHIEDLPRKITDEALWFHDSFCTVVNSALFSVYDSILSDAVQGLYIGWNRALSHYGIYRPAGHGRYIFSNPMDAPLDEMQQVAWDDIEEGRIEMEKSIQIILSRLREAYLEINIKKTSEQAWDTYLKFNKSE
ncbi:TIR domain-containing protein [Acetobacter aceti]|nr:TIR domain-containing protein [Acetobacter aceti]